MRASLSLAAGLIALAAVIPHAASAGSPPVALTTSAGPAIVGTVNDSAGNPLSNVQVVLAPLNRTTTTDASGSFEFRGLPAGTYHLSTLQIGFAPAHADVVLPSAGEDVRVRIVLRRTALQLAAIQVTATPVATDARNVAQSTVEVSGEALARNLAPTVAQTLSREPGLAQRFGGPGANTPVIRGLSGERVLVLQDGGRAADLSSTSSDHSLSIDPLAAQRIEVVRGPASLLYGNNALGGVVNVISNDIPTQIPSHVDGSFATQGETATPGGAIAAGAAVPINANLALVARGSARRGGDLRQGGGVTLPNSYLRNASGVGGFAFSSEAASGGAIYRGYGFKYGL